MTGNSEFRIGTPEKQKFISSHINLWYFRFAGIKLLVVGALGFWLRQIGSAKRHYRICWKPDGSGRNQCNSKAMGFPLIFWGCTGKTLVIGFPLFQSATWLLAKSPKENYMSRRSGCWHHEGKFLQSFLQTRKLSRRISVARDACVCSFDHRVSIPSAEKLWRTLCDDAGEKSRD